VIAVSHDDAVVHHLGGHRIALGTVSADGDPAPLAGIERERR